MKRTKTFSIDDEVFEGLKQITNASALVNSYLRAYMEIGKVKSKRDEQTDKILDEVIDAKLE